MLHVGLPSAELACHVLALVTACWPSGCDCKAFRVGRKEQSSVFDWRTCSYYSIKVCSLYNLEMPRLNLNDKMKKAQAAQVSFEALLFR